MLTPGYKTVDSFLAGAALIAGCAVFCLCGLWRLGDLFLFLCTDEIFKHVLVLNVIDIFAGRQGADVFFTLFGDARMPFCMYSEHVGAPWLYPAALSVALLGPALGSFAAFKLVMLAAGAVTLAAVYFVLRRVFDFLTAALAVFFLASNYVYIRALRIGFLREEVLQVAGLWCGLWMIQLGLARRKMVWLSVGFFVFGLTFWAKVMFMGYIVAAAAGMLVCGSFARQSFKRGFVSGRAVRAAVGAFLLGAAPMLCFNLRYGFPVFRKLAAVLTGTAKASAETGQWGELGLVGKLVCRLTDAAAYVSGSFFEPDFFNPVFVAFAVPAGLWGLWTLCFGKDISIRRAVRFMSAAAATLIVLICFVPFGYSRGHMLLIVPFFEVLCALFLAHVLRWRRLAPLMRLALGAAVLLLWLGGQGLNFARFRDRYFVRGDFSGLWRVERDGMCAALERAGARGLVSLQPLADVIGCRPNGFDVVGCVTFEEVLESAAFFLDTRRGEEVYVLMPFKEMLRSNGSLRLRMPGLSCERLSPFEFRARKDCRFELYRIRPEARG